MLEKGRFYKNPDIKNGERIFYLSQYDADRDGSLHEVTSQYAVMAYVDNPKSLSKLAQKAVNRILYGEFNNYMSA